ncbi:lytic transglycosylase F [Thioalkalivibrio denitrificans]|uniref:Membrane-bound lytic murein transglycosylase F n=1 Tax=Thioalkalivibrio denitrificans TaxID=108003 RepID=A0A1V3ND17_9GAMM|nr:membrane-bound lytic murein transglycosylase MltF [Thioalkalivibrio denitrificans]OOG22941.1 lytic transglycosylase F [Thioalkalivibrio denitrificans]
MRPAIFSNLRLALGLGLSLSLSACSSEEAASPDLEAISDRGELLVITRNAPTTYYYGRDGEVGFEYELVSAFAEHLGVSPRFVIRDSVDDVINALEAGEGDLAAAGLTRTAGREGRFAFGPGYLAVQQQLVCRRGGANPGSIEDLADVQIMVTASSSYVERLEELRTEVPDLTWEARPDLTTEQILELVWKREVDCAVADSNIVAINRRYFPELQVIMPLTEEESLAWMLPPDSRGLRRELERWFAGLDDNGLLSTLQGRYYGHVDIFDYVDVARYRRRIHSRLPRFRPLFEEAAETHGLDWTLLAAQAYQESHWDPSARSPTGVRGMMMLTLRTAGDLGVDNRLDPAQSIHGGARYLADLRNRLPDSVEEPDRTWIALAAYNIGMGHVFDARGLARDLGRDPDNWVEFREVLPLLAQPRYHRNLRFGYARGSEPVEYVRRIRNYREILIRELDD